MSDKRVIAVIGATGAQGRFVIRHLLAPAADGTPSPWAVRGLTRDKSHHSAQELIAEGVDLVEGSVTDLASVAILFRGAYGAFVNTDTFQLGPKVELHTLYRLYEVAQQARLQHYVFSSLPYALKLGNWDPKYTVEHLNTKGRFADWMSKSGESNMISTNLQTGPYMDSLTDNRGPVTILPDGTRLWLAPKVSEHDGPLPYIALDDIGWWARYIVDNPKEAARIGTFALVSEPVTPTDVTNAFTKVTGLPAKVHTVPIEEYYDNFVDGARVPLVLADPDGISFRDNFTAYYHFYTSNTLKYDLDWIRRVHPGTRTVEQWMRENDYKGQPQIKQSLKLMSDKTGFGPVPDREKFGRLLEDAANV